MNIFIAADKKKITLQTRSPYLFCFLTIPIICIFCYSPIFQHCTTSYYWNKKQTISPQNLRYKLNLFEYCDSNKSGFWCNYFSIFLYYSTFVITIGCVTQFRSTSIIYLLRQHILVFTFFLHLFFQVLLFLLK